MKRTGIFAAFSVFFFIILSFTVFAENNDFTLDSVTVNGTVIEAAASVSENAVSEYGEIALFALNSFDDVIASLPVSVADVSSKTVFSVSLGKPDYSLYTKVWCLGVLENGSYRRVSDFITADPISGDGSEKGCAVGVSGIDSVSAQLLGSDVSAVSVPFGSLLLDNGKMTEFIYGKSYYSVNTALLSILDTQITSAFYSGNRVIISFSFGDNGHPDISECISDNAYISAMWFIADRYGEYCSDFVVGHGSFENGFDETFCKASLLAVKSADPDADVYIDGVTDDRTDVFAYLKKSGLGASLSSPDIDSAETLADIIGRSEETGCGLILNGCILPDDPESILPILSFAGSAINGSGSVKALIWSNTGRSGKPLFIIPEKTENAEICRAYRDAFGIGVLRLVPAVKECGKTVPYSDPSRLGFFPTDSVSSVVFCHEDIRYARISPRSKNGGFYGIGRKVVCRLNGEISVNVTMRASESGKAAVVIVSGSETLVYETEIRGDDFVTLKCGIPEGFSSDNCFMKIWFIGNDTSSDDCFDISSVDFAVKRADPTLIRILIVCIAISAAVTVSLMILKGKDAKHHGV